MIQRLSVAVSFALALVACAGEARAVTEQEARTEVAGAEMAVTSADDAFFDALVDQNEASAIYSDAHSRFMAVSDEMSEYEQSYVRSLLEDALDEFYAGDEYHYNASCSLDLAKGCLEDAQADLSAGAWNSAYANAQESYSHSMECHSWCSEASCAFSVCIMNCEDALYYIEQYED